MLRGIARIPTWGTQSVIRGKQSIFKSKYRLILLIFHYFFYFSKGRLVFLER
jgi:hypothetical protein